MRNFFSIYMLEYKVKETMEFWSVAMQGLLNSSLLDSPFSPDAYIKKFTENSMYRKCVRL